MSEFDLKPEDLKHEVLQTWKCSKCAAIQTKWEAATVCSTAGCDSVSFERLNTAKTVPVTTGYYTELTFDNIDSIDADSDEHFESIESNRDLEQLEKARR